MTPTAVISDTHIGTDEAKRFEPALMAFLDHAAAEGWRVVFNGDTFDLWAYSWAYILGTCKDLVTKIRKYPFEKILIAGNHDDDIANLARLSWSQEDQIKRYLQLGDFCVMHGYQLDRRLDDAWERDTVHLLDRLSHIVDLTALNKARLALQQSDRTNTAMIENFKKLGLNVCVGHSHVPWNVVAKDDAGSTLEYLNTGSWTGSGNHPPYYALFDEDAIPQLRAWPLQGAGNG